MYFSEKGQHVRKTGSVLHKPVLRFGKIECEVVVVRYVNAFFKDFAFHVLLRDWSVVTDFSSILVSVNWRCSHLPAIRNLSKSSDVLEDFAQNFAEFSGSPISTKTLEEGHLDHGILLHQSGRLFLDCSLR